jgi:hypothetical protein
MLLLWAPALVGWGLLLARNARYLGLSSTPPPSIGLLGLLGILGVGVAGGTFNLFVGLRDWFPLCTLGIGWVAVISLHPEWRERFSYRTILASVITGTLVSFSTLFADFVYDAGLYHLPSIRWSLDSALPFGLANLNSYTGYNSMWFLFSAALALPGFEQQGMAMAETLAFFFFIFFLLEPLFNYQRARNDKLALSLLTLAVFCLAGLEAGVGSNSTDLPLAVYLMGCTLLFLEKEYFLAALFGAFSFAVKLSGGPVALLFIATCVYFMPSRKRLLSGALISGILSLCVIRGVILSGCAMYPETRSCLSGLSWTVKPALVAERNHDVRNSAGSCLVRPNEQIANCFLNELAPALFKHRVVQALLFSVLFALAGFLLQHGTASKQGIFVQGYRLAIVYHTLGLGFWVLTAPDPRFGVAHLVALSVLPLAAMFNSLRPTRAAAFSGWMIVLALAGLWSKRLFVLSEATPLKHPWPEIAQVTVIETKLATGQTAYLPAEGYSCGLSNPPCRVPAAYPLAMGTKWGRPLFYSPSPQETP